MSENLKRNTRRQKWWVLGLIGGIIPLSIVLGLAHNISVDLAVTVAIVAALVLGTLAVWMNANAHANGNEWWQDDQCSGWRGY